MNPSAISPRQAIYDKFNLGVTRMEAAEQNPSAIEQALLSFHGALEDHLRLMLSQLASLPAETRAAVRDRGKVQWRDLASLAQASQLITRQDLHLILQMNRKRQAVAHGQACDLSKQEVLRYAEFISATIESHESAAPAPPPAAPPPAAPPPAAPPAAASRPARPAAARRSSSSSIYNIAVAIAAIILLVMIGYVGLMIIQ